MVLASADALLSAGRVSNVSDPEVRRWISAWPGRYAVFDRQREAVDDFARVEVFRYFASRQLSYASVPRRGLIGEDRPGPTRDPALMRRLVGDPGLETLWVQGARMSFILLYDSRVLRGYLEEGRQLLRAEQAR